MSDNSAMNAGSLKLRLDRYERLMRLDKPIGTLLLLWPTLWALWIAADGRPRWEYVAIFALGTLLMRSAGCVLNDIADRNFDPYVKRTRERPLASGEVSVAEALALAGVLALAAFTLVLFLNALTIGLSFAALAVAASYPLFKRFFAIPQAYLGIAFGFGIPMAFAAVQSRVPGTAWWMLGANVLWAIAYDTEYAMVDRDDDLKLGLRSSAITFGRWDVAAVAACYVGVIAILAGIAVHVGAGLFYYAGLLVAGAMMGAHIGWIKGRDRAQCFRAFNHNNWVGGAIFAGILLDYLGRTWPTGT